MRDLVKIYRAELDRAGALGSMFVNAVSICQRKLAAQIGRNDFTVLSIHKVDNIRERCLDCYVDYEFWGGK